MVLEAPMRVSRGFLNAARYDPFNHKNTYGGKFKPFVILWLMCYSLIRSYDGKPRERMRERERHHTMKTFETNKSSQYKYSSIPRVQFTKHWEPHLTPAGNISQLTGTSLSHTHSLLAQSAGRKPCSVFLLALRPPPSTVNILGPSGFFHNPTNPIKTDP